MPKFVPRVSFEQMLRAAQVSQGTDYLVAIPTAFAPNLDLIQALSDRMTALDLTLRDQKDVFKNYGIPDYAIIHAAAIYPLSDEHENPLINNTPTFDPEKFLTLAQRLANPDQ